jgi:DNA-binding CsgD family transcriptional regulator
VLLIGYSIFCSTIDSKQSNDEVVMSDSEKTDSRLRRLSPRELTILKLVALGVSSKEIAARIGISIRTVDFHRANLIRKTGLHSVADLTRLAVSANLLSDSEYANHPVEQIEISGWFEISSTNQDQHCEWRLFSGVGSLLLSGDCPIQREELEATISKVRASSLIGESYRRHVKPHSAPFFRLHDLNGSILANSPEFPSVNAMELGIQNCKESAPIAILAKNLSHLTPAADNDPGKSSTITVHQQR